MKVSLRPSVTTDGFIANKKGECYYWINPADEARYVKAVKDAGCELVGRKTYEKSADRYPSREFFTFVYTSDTSFRDTEKIKFLHGSPEDVIKQIADYGFSEVILSGGGDLNGSLASAGVIDEIILSIHPIVLGEGISLFGSYKPELNLKLISSNTDVKGIVQNCYEVIK